MWLVSRQSMILAVLGGTIGVLAAAFMTQTLQAGGGSGVDINNTEFLNHLDPVLARPFLDGFSSAIDLVFLTGGIVMVVAFALVWFLREKPLSTKSGLERVADAETVAV